MRGVPANHPAINKAKAVIGMSKPSMRVFVGADGPAPEAKASIGYNPIVMHAKIPPE